MKKSYEVQILNQKFVLKSEHDAKHVRKISDFVNETVDNIKEKTGGSLSTQNIAILAALNIAEELFQQDIENKEMVDNWKKRLTHIMEKVY